METTKADIRSMSHKELLSFTENLLAAFNEAMLRIAALEQEVEKLRRDKNNNSDNASTKGYHARKCEQRLLRRLAKFKMNHLLFAYDFRVEFTNNISERDLRKVKGRQKIAGGFRKNSGKEIYCKIMSVVETLKKRSENLFEKIKQKFAIPLVDLGLQPV